MFLNIVMMHVLHGFFYLFLSMCLWLLNTSNILNAIKLVSKLKLGEENKSQIHLMKYLKGALL